MERAVEIFAAVQFAVIGLSHMLQPGAWVEFFVWLRGKGRAGVFVVGFLSLGFGALVVAFHNVWHGWPVVLTIVGWAHVLKAAVYFAAPQVGLRSLGRVSAERAREFVIAGAVMIGLSILLTWVAITQ